MLKRIQHYIKRNHLPSAPSSLLVALSGGADSVALTLILHKLGYVLTALHCNFRLRGEESDRDEHFVREFCQQLNVNLHVTHFDTLQYAEEKGISIEMAARELRYEWFEKMRQQTQAVAIAVAHHSDDNAETLLLNLARGSGIRGLKGMLPQQGHIIRPLLCVRRCELEHYLEESGQSFVTDSTNTDILYKRNKIRHEVLPLLRQLNPAIDEGLSQTASRLAETEILYNEAVNEQRRKICQTLSDGILIQLNLLQQQATAATLLHEFLLPYGFTPATIAMIGHQLQRPTGTSFHSATHMAVIHRGHLEIRKNPIPVLPTPLPSEGILQLVNGLSLEMKSLDRELLTEIPKQQNKVGLDDGSLQKPLFIRSVQEGDRFQPFGMKGSKLVSDYLTDRHRSLIDKQKALVLCDQKGIVWLIGERNAQRAAITDTTRKVLLVSLHDYPFSATPQSPHTKKTPPVDNSSVPCG